MRRLFLVAVIVTVAASGCIRPRPKTGPSLSPLDVPPPPPRVVVPPEPEQPEEETPPGDLDAGKDKKPITRPQGRPNRDRQEPAKPAELPKPEAPPPEPPKPPVTAPVAPLQPALNNPLQAQKQVEAQLAQARKDLGSVDVRGLSDDGKNQYETAQQFIAQAGTALREGNIVFAQKLAEKAVGLAANLVRR